MTQGDLADAINVSRPKMVNIEKGSEKTTIGDIIAVAKALSVDVKEIIEDFL